MWRKVASKSGVRTLVLLHRVGRISLVMPFSSLEGRFVRLELGVADSNEGMDFLEQSMEKAVEDLKVQIQDLQEGMQSSSIHAVSHEKFVIFQDRVLSMLASLESRVEVLTKNEEKLRQEVAIYKTALSARVMATHEAPRAEVPKPHTFNGKQDAMAVAESLMDYKESMSSNDEGLRVSHSSGGGEEVSPREIEDDCSTDGEKRCPVVLPGMRRARCPTLGKIKASVSNRSLRQS